MSLTAAQTLHIGNTTVQLSNVDRVLFPEDGITKGDLIDHYLAVAECMLPHLSGRPLVLERYPQGLAEKGFIQQEASQHFPPWVDRATVARKEGGNITHVVCNSAATLAYLANQGVITVHPWLAQADRPTYPDQLIFDLDPPDDDFDIVRQAARELYELLDELGLPAFLKTTGGRGLHVTVPLVRRQEFDTVRNFAQDVAATLVDRQPDRLTTHIRKQQRQGRLYLDTARNAYGQTAVAPYAVRARPGAPVATPLHWEELDDSNMHPSQFTIHTIRQRLDIDPWKQMSASKAVLTKAQRRLDTVKPQSS